MKKIIVCLVLIAFAVFALPAAESDVILRARNDAEVDGRDYSAFWWSVGGAATTVFPVLMTAFFADGIPVEARRVIALTAPVVGGAGLALVGFTIGKAEVPEARIAEASVVFGDSSLVERYRSEYEQAMTKIRRRKQGVYSLLGSGVAIGAGVLGFLVVYLTK